jgi:hypothetical protein
MVRQTVILVIRADRTTRVARKPRLAADEIGVRINLAFPDNWGKVVGDIDITVPDFTPEVRYEQVGSE